MALHWFGFYFSGSDKAHKKKLFTFWHVSTKRIVTARHRKAVKALTATVADQAVRIADLRAVRLEIKRSFDAKKVMHDFALETLRNTERDVEVGTLK